MTLTILKTDSQDDFIGSCTNVTRFVDIVGSSRSHCKLVVSGGWHFSRYISRLHFEKDESLSLWSSTLQVSHYLGSERIFLEKVDWLCYLCVFLVLNIKYDLPPPPPQTLHPHIHQHFQGIVPLFLSELSFLCCDKQRYVGGYGFAAFSCKLISSCADFNCRSEIEECAYWWLWSKVKINILDMFTLLMLYGFF